MWKQYQEIILFLYAIGKAFLPLPSLEVILVPMVIAKTNSVWILSLIGACGTFIGGAIGYAIAYLAGRRIILRFTSEKQLIIGEQLLQRYGVLAIFIGGITPVPDFVLAYLAGLMHMNFWLFACTDALARFLRSLLVGYLVQTLGYVFNLDRWGTVLSLVVIALLI